MNLKDFIAQIGTAEFAKRFEVPLRTAEAYRQCRRRPRSELAEKIVKTSPVTWEGIYRLGGEEKIRTFRPTVKGRKAKKRLNS